MRAFSRREGIKAKLGLNKAICETIDYAKKYKARLTANQVWFRLFSKKRFSQKEVTAEMKKMRLKLKTTGERMIDNRKQLRAKKFCDDYLSRIPSIRLVGVTGSVAAENSRKNEDIDILLICAPGTLWQTRLSLRWYLKRKNIPHRRYGQIEKADEFCFNLWLEENRLGLPSEKRVRKSAIDLIMMKVIMDSGGVYEEFIKNNQWAEKYVANGYRKISKIKTQRLEIRAKKNYFMTCLNEVAYWGQIGFIRLKGPIKYIDKSRAFFHDTQKE